MEQAEPREPAGAQAVGASAQTPMVLPGGHLAHEHACPTCMQAAPAQSASAYVYAIGRIEPRFPSIAVEKELAQATARAETVGKTDRQAFHAVLSARENRYLVRQLCWVLTVRGLEVCILQPRESLDLDLLIEATRAEPSQLDTDVVIGVRGPVAPPEHCNGLLLPIVVFDQVYSFDRQELIGAIPKPDGIDEDEFTAAAGELFDRVLQLTNNVGMADEHRALNYLAVRYPAIYAAAAEAHTRDSSLSAVQVRPSSLGAAHRILDVVFSFTNRKTDVVDKQFVSVDVTGEWPFLVTKLSPYFDR